MELKLKLLMTKMPNYLAVELPNSMTTENGKLEAPRIGVEELTQEQAQEYADEMRVAFMEHWQHQRTMPRAEQG